MIIGKEVRCFVLALAACATAVVHAGSTPASLEMELQVAKTDILVGEPIIVLVTLRGQAALDLEVDLTFPAAPFRILIDRGHGFIPYVEKSFWPDDQDLAKTPLTNGEERLEYVLSVDDATGDWIFPAPGAYAVVAEYHDDTLGPVRSNVVTVNVRAPSGEEKIVHDALRAKGPSVLGDHHAGWAGDLVDLIQEYPRSAYLQEPRLLDLISRQHNIIAGYDPMADRDTGEYPPPRPNFLPGVQKAWSRVYCLRLRSWPQRRGSSSPMPCLSWDGSITPSEKPTGPD